VWEQHNEQRAIARQRPATAIKELLGVVFSMWSGGGIYIVWYHCLATTSEDKDDSVFAAVIRKMCRLARVS
jgi:hypothetical protein